jgi:chaperonin GroEL (HSP60 family)
MKRKASIQDRIRAAKTATTVNKLVKEAGTFKFAAAKTLRKIARVASARLEEIAAK